MLICHCDVFGPWYRRTVCCIDRLFCHHFLLLHTYMHSNTHTHAHTHTHTLCVYISFVCTYYTYDFIVGHLSIMLLVNNSSLLMKFIIEEIEYFSAVRFHNAVETMANIRIAVVIDRFLLQTKMHLWLIGFLWQTKGKGLLMSLDAMA